MNPSDLELRLGTRLRERGESFLPRSESVVGLGIDLGTTKTSVAYARFDPASGKLECECVRFNQADGTARVGVPSAVAITEQGARFGVAALALRGRRGYSQERGLFCESKNEVGLRYTYARAPEGFRNATEIATQLLTHLRAEIVDPRVRNAPAPLVVTVPASFHGAQRTATVRAAESAFSVGSVRLLDEPYAAFLDLKWRQPAAAAGLMREGANVLVFDFGGGTCDVAIFRIDSVRGGTSARAFRDPLNKSRGRDDG
jgi:molecular chaperone DnaK (HSP70)